MRISDWSSDVCSSDLLGFGGVLHGRARRTIRIRCGHRTLDVVIPLVVNGDIAAHMPIGDRPVGFGTELGIEHRSEEHTSELQSLMRISYAVFCLKNKTQTITQLIRCSYATIYC